MQHDVEVADYVETHEAQDPEVVEALAGLVDAMTAQKKMIDVGPELMAELHHYVTENNVVPRVVKSKSQAKRMTAKDPGGYKWRVGERYFMLVAHKGAA